MPETSHFGVDASETDGAAPPPARITPTAPPRSSRDRHPGEFHIRSIFWTVYTPTFLLSFGQGLVLASVPLFARELGVGLLLVGIATAAREVGNMLFDVPSGSLVTRFGTKKTMVAGTTAIGFIAIGAGLSTGIYVFITLRLIQGFATALWSISRQAYIADVVPVHRRGRALALFGGVNRIATIIGPIAGGLLAHYLGLASTFYAQGGVVLFTAALVFLLMRGQEGATARKHAEESLIASIGVVVRDHRKDFATAGVAAICLQLVRRGRQALLPLWGDAIGLDFRAIGYVMGVSSAVDSLFFYPVGVVMDRWGRKWVFVPSLIVLGVSLALLPLANTYVALMAVGILSGVGNGISSGIVFTLGVDLAPRDRTGEFIGVWRLIGDIGGSAGPFVVGGIAQAVTLGTASVATGGFGFLGAAIAYFFVRETLIKPENRSKTEADEKPSR